MCKIYGEFLTLKLEEFGKNCRENKHFAILQIMGSFGMKQFDDFFSTRWRFLKNLPHCNL